MLERLLGVIKRISINQSNGLTAVFPGEPGVSRTQQIALRHLTLSAASSLFSFSKLMSLSMQFVHVSNGLPRCLCPSTSTVWLSLVK